MKKKFLVVLLLVAAGFGVYLIQSGDDADISREIITTEINRGNISRSIATTGPVRALVTVEVGSQLSGQIAELYADFNTQVKADQVIALIDPQSFEKRVRQAEADLKVAKANVTVQEATITRAEANLRRAKLDYERQKPLVEKGTLPATNLDTALAGFESAQAELVMAQAQLRNAQAVVEQREAALSSATIDLDRTKIRSPIDGVVILRNVSVGQTVAASFSSPVLFNIAQDLRHIQLEANVDESDIGNVREGNNVTFNVDAFPDDKFSGVVTQIRLAPQELTNVVTYTVIISASNPDLKLLPGMTANIEIVTGKRENVLRVANDALRFRPKGVEDAQEPQVAASGFSPGGSGGGGFRGPGGSNQMLLSRLEPLHLDEAKLQEIQNAVSESFAAMRNELFGGGSAAPGGLLGGGPPRPPGGAFDRSEMSQRIDNMIERVLQQHLTPEQMEQYRQSNSTARNVRHGEIWLDAGGKDPQRRPVTLGISDDEYTELLDTDLQPGTVVITRIRENKS
jgi:HlyD family secretion protein